ncbi:MAG: ribosomal protein S20 [Flavobacteriaceae bacterium]|jgi:ribosomal protein S20
MKIVDLFSESVTLLLNNLINMMKLKLINTALILFVISLAASAQKNFAKDADAAFRNEAYYSAVDLYKKAFPKAPKAEEKARIIFQIAESYRLTTNAEMAEIFYQKSIEMDYSSKQPIIHLKLGNVLRQQGKYSEAIDSYLKYKQIVKDTPRADKLIMKSRLLKTGEALGDEAQHSLSIIVVDMETRKPVSNARIKVVGTDNSSYEVKTDENGVFSFETNGKDRYIKDNVTYSIEVDQTDYLVAKDQVSTVLLKESRKFVRQLKLQNAESKHAISIPGAKYSEINALIKPKKEHSDIAEGNLNGIYGLNELYTTLTDNPTINIELQAHTDHRGGAMQNISASQARAQSCLDYLVGRGISKDRLSVRGLGATQPLLGFSEEEIMKLETEEEKEAAHQKNRRTEFIVLNF